MSRTNSAMTVRIVADASVWALADGLNAIEHDRVVKDGLRMGVSYILGRGRRNLRDRMKKRTGKTGNLLSSMRIKVKKLKPGALAGFEMPKGKHSWLVDQGTKERHYNGKSTGAGKPLKYWEDAKNQEIDNAYNIVIKGVERAVQRLRNRR